MNNRRLRAQSRLPRRFRSGMSLDQMPWIDWWLTRVSTGTSPRSLWLASAAGPQLAEEAFQSLYRLRHSEGSQEISTSTSRARLLGQVRSKLGSSAIRMIRCEENVLASCIFADQNMIYCTSFILGLIYLWGPILDERQCHLERLAFLFTRCCSGLED